MKKQKELEYSVHVVKSLYENYIDYKASGDEAKANLMLEKLIETGKDIISYSEELIKR